MLPTRFHYLEALKGCYNSDFDQYGELEAFGNFPDWQRVFPPGEVRQEIGFNGDYLKELMRAAKVMTKHRSNPIKLETYGATSPAKITGEGVEFILMPMRV